MGTAPGPAHLLEVCEQKLLEFICHVDNKDLVWLEEIEEEAVRMFTRDFNKEPELMPKTPSQKNRKKKRRISYVQDENRDPVRKRLSCKKTRSSQRLSRQLRGKDKVEKLVTAAGESPVLRRVTRATAAANPAPPTVPVAIPESTTASAQKPEPSLAPPLLVPIVQIQARERQSADEQLRQLQCAGALSPASPSSDEPSTPTKPGPGRPESVAVSALMSTPQDSKGRVPGAGRSASKLRIAQATPGPQDSPVSPWQERVLVPILPPNCTTPTGARPDSRSVRRSLMSPANQKVQVSLAEKFSLMARQELPIRRSSRLANKGPEEPAPSARIICHSYLERLLNVEVPQKVSPPHKGQEPSQEPMELAELEVPKDEASSCPRSASKIAISTPSSQAVATDPQTPPGGFPEVKADHADGAKEQPLSARRKRSYRQAVSDLDEDAELPLDDEDEEEELQPPRSKTPSPPCPASKVVRPLRTFLHTVQRNQLLMTPTSTPGSSSIVKSFIKRNTPLRVDPKEKERQRLETLRRKQEAELLRRQKVEEEKRRRLEEAKLKREERLRKALQTRKQAEQMKEEKKKQIEQKFAQLEEKNEKAKEERLAEEKARKKAAARKMEEVEARRKQEEEARRLRWLRQEEEERRRLEQQRQKEQELEQERQRKAAEARRQAEQREQERRRELERLQAEREQQEREKALQKELEEKKKKEEQQRLAEQRLQEEQERKAKEAEASRVLNMTVDVQSPSCTSYQMTPQGPRNAPKINPDNYGMDLNSDDSTDDEAHPRKPIPAWARGTQLSQAIIHQYYQSWDLLDLFGSILPLDLEDIFKKNKPRYHKRTSSAVWSSPPLQGPRAPGSLAYSLKKF